MNAIGTLEEAAKRTKQQMGVIYKRVEKKLAEEAETSQESSEDTEESDKESSQIAVVKPPRAILPAIRKSARKPRNSAARVRFEDDVGIADGRNEIEDATKDK